MAGRLTGGPRAGTFPFLGREPVPSSMCTVTVAVSEVRSVNEYTVILAVMPDGADAPRLVLKQVTTSSARVAIAEATAAVHWQHDDAAPRVGDAFVFNGRVEIASAGRPRRRDRPNPASGPRGIETVRPTERPTKPQAAPGTDPNRRTAYRQG